MRKVSEERVWVDFRSYLSCETRRRDPSQDSYFKSLFNFSFVNAYFVRVLSVLHYVQIGHSSPYSHKYKYLSSKVDPRLPN